MSGSYARARETDLCTLTIGELSRRHVFQPPYSVAEFDWPEARVAVSYQAVHQTLSLMIQRRSSTVLKHVSVCSRQLPFGEGHEFLCPCCDMRRKMLILDGKDLVCGPHFRATGGGSHSSRRAALKDARQMRFKPVRAERAPAAQDGAAAGVRRLRTDELSTHWAIKHALGGGQLTEFLEFCELGRAEIESGALVDLEEPLDRASLEYFPALDIRELHSNGWLRPGALRAWQLGWNRQNCEGFRLALFADLRDGYEPALFVGRRLPNEAFPTWLHLRLRPRGGAARRWQFDCPVRNTPADILYFRAGHFASRQGQRLIYPSQRTR
jgi:hypothetical protein